MFPTRVDQESHPKPVGVDGDVRVALPVVDQ